MYDTARPFMASFVLLRKKGSVAFVLRSHTDWMNGYYGLPAGKVELGERAMAAAVREAKEEAGVKIKEADLEFVHLCHRKSGDNSLMWVDVLFEVANWEGEPYNAEPYKHSELKWLDPKNLPNNTIPAVKHYIQQISAGKVYSEFGW